MEKPELRSKMEKKSKTSSKGSKVVSALTSGFGYWSNEDDQIKEESDFYD